MIILDIVTELKPYFDWARLKFPLTTLCLHAFELSALFTWGDKSQTISNHKLAVDKNFLTVYVIELCYDNLLIVVDVCKYVLILVDICMYVFTVITDTYHSYTQQVISVKKLINQEKLRSS